MRKQMWKKRVCFVLAMILAALAVTPVEMDHADAAMVHSVTALMTGNLVNKSNADKLTYRQMETSAYERKLISKSVYNYTMQQVPALYEGRNVINVSGMTGKANTSYVDDDGIGENVSFVKFQCRKSGKYQFTESNFKGKSKNEVIYNDNNYLMFLPKELKNGYEIYDPWNSTYYQFLSRNFASGYGKIWYDVKASKKLTRSANRAIKNSAGYTASIQRELQKKKDTISRYRMETETNTYRLKKGNTYLLVIFTPDSFRFRKKITKENNYYKEQYLSDIPWSFDLKITYMDEKAD